jgi:hypothetical protein
LPLILLVIWWPKSTRRTEYEHRDHRDALCNPNPTRNQSSVCISKNFNRKLLCAYVLGNGVGEKASPPQNDLDCRLRLPFIAWISILEDIMTLLHRASSLLRATSDTRGRIASTGLAYMCLRNTRLMWLADELAILHGARSGTDASDPQPHRHARILSPVSLQKPKKNYIKVFLQVARFSSVSTFLLIIRLPPKLITKCLTSKQLSLRPSEVFTSKATRRSNTISPSLMASSILTIAISQSATSNGDDVWR